MKTMVNLFKGLFLYASLPSMVFAVNVTVNASSNLFTVANTAFGMHTSVYANQWGNSSLPTRFNESGVNTLRYPGGAYADTFHFSICRASWENGITGGGMSPGMARPGDASTNYAYVAGSSDFGKFVQVLDKITNARAVITVNASSSLKLVNGRVEVPSYNGQPKEAAAWVAYANGDPSLFGTANDITIGVDQEGNNWKTVGYWAKLRSSTSAQYSSWATAAGVYDSYNAFLAINHPNPVGIKYWEIGNEMFGTGYYVAGTDGYAENYAVPYHYTDNARYGNALLSPAAYGQEVNAFAQAMKAVDATVKIGAIVSTPPGDYSWDSYGGQEWSEQVLAQCATNTDFVIAHWYPWNGGNDNGSVTLPLPASTIPTMINGTTAGQDSGSSAGIRDWINHYRPADGTNVEIFITEFGINGSVSSSYLGVVNSLFALDCYATWMRYGVANIDYLEMSSAAFIGDGSSLPRGEVFYALQMLRKMAGPGDQIVSTTSGSSNLRVHAALQQSNKLGVVLINQSRTASQTASVTVTGVSLTNTGTIYQFGTNNFSGTTELPASAPSSNSITGLGNSFSVTLPAYTMAVLVIPLIPPAPQNTAPVLASLPNQTVNVGQSAGATPSVTDSDLPSQTFTFELLSAPDRTTLNTNTGVFSWRPYVSDATTTNTFTLKVTDSGTPSMSATQSCTVIVNPLTIPTLVSAGYSAGNYIFNIQGDVGPDYAVQVSSNLLDWSTIATNTPLVMPFTFTDTNAGAAPTQFYRVIVGPPLQ